MSDTAKPHYAFIECVRGYAVLLVIVCHATSLFPELPYPVRRFTEMGWHGVQMFFLASAVTLMMSWRHELARKGHVSASAFFIRRLFRIAPAYYAAAAFYFVLIPPPHGFELRQAAASFLFINAWHPTWTPTTPGAWTVVPGGWSIGVEFTFYAAFPLLAAVITSLPRALWLLLATLLAGATVNSLLWPLLSAAYDPVPASNFLYFWFPNQMSVFALGLCLYFVLQQDEGRSEASAWSANLLAVLSISLAMSASFAEGTQWLALWPPAPPTFLLVSLAMSLFILALSRARSGPFINPAVALTGRVSFSAYLLHFAALDLLGRTPLMRPVFAATGWSAIAAFPLAVIGVFIIVVPASWCTYRLIETPMIRFGQALVRGRRLAVPLA